MKIVKKRLKGDVSDAKDIVVYNSIESINGIIPLTGVLSPKQIKDLEVLRDVLDKRQLALKVSANSGYGAMGVVKGRLPFMPGAMATTFKGREAIQKVAEVIQSPKYRGELVYGDTDSNYVRFPHIKTAQEAWDYSEYVAAEITKLFPPPIKC
jgi:DNA polymerase elongation subunit (family B)